ncbi:hypothetical protein [Piscinibacter sakaiensis]|uniref:hypothetical protein n=1 Tax=Piscinibacter sakaiensis TaxID=1547922 RepID=UPI003AAED856
MGQQILAAIGLAVCVLLVVRLLLSPPRRHRFDATAQQGWIRLKSGAIAIWHWRRNRREAERAARDAINRAAGRKDGGNWDGNVYQAKSFRKPRKPH